MIKYFCKNIAEIKIRVIIFFCFFASCSENLFSSVDVAAILKGDDINDQSEASPKMVEETLLAAKRRELFHLLMEQLFDIFTTEVSDKDLSVFGKDKKAVKDFLTLYKKKFLLKVSDRIDTAIEFEKNFFTSLSDNALRKVIHFFKSSAGKEFYETKVLLLKTKPLLESAEYEREFKRNLSLETEQKLNEFLKTNVGARFFRLQNISERIFLKVAEKCFEQEEQHLSDELLKFLESK